MRTMTGEDIFSFKRPDDSPGFLLWQVSSLWQRNLNTLLKTHGLTHTQFVVLASLYWLTSNLSQINQVQIAEHAKIDPMLVSNILKTLERKKLIKRSSDKTDTRANNVTITSGGKKLLKISVKEVEDFDRSFFDCINNDISTFNAQLLKILERRHSD